MTAAENTEKTPMSGAPKIDFDRFRPNPFRHPAP